MMLYGENTINYFLLINEIGAAKTNKSVKKCRSLGDILAFGCRSQFIAIALPIS